jgi:hypothetical protein
MAWDGPYYYRSRRVSGQVKNEYIGTGPLADMLALLDEMEREARQDEQEARQAEQERIVDADRDVDDLIQGVNVVVQAALLASGYHAHKRQWRRKIGK